MGRGFVADVPHWCLLRDLFLTEKNCEFIVCSRDSYGLYPVNAHNVYRGFIGISHRGMLVGVHPTVPEMGREKIDP